MGMILWGVSPLYIIQEGVRFGNLKVLSEGKVGSLGTDGQVKTVTGVFPGAVFCCGWAGHERKRI